MRSSWQPLDLVASTVESLLLVLQCLAEADNLDDLFRRLEACGALLRLDPAVEPTMFRGAIVSPAERAVPPADPAGRTAPTGTSHRHPSDRARRGRGPDRPRHHPRRLHRYGLRATPPRPIFDNRQITTQSLMGGFTTFNAAMVGFVEAARDNDTDKNRLCPPTAFPSKSIDWMSVFEGGFRVITQMLQEPDLATWLGACRLNDPGHERPHGRPRMQAALGRWFEHMEPALANAQRLRAAPVS